MTNLTNIISSITSNIDDIERKNGEIILHHFDDDTEQEERKESFRDLLNDLFIKNDKLKELTRTRTERRTMRRRTGSKKKKNKKQKSKGKKTL